MVLSALFAVAFAAPSGLYYSAPGPVVSYAAHAPVATYAHAPVATYAAHAPVVKAVPVAPAVAVAPAVYSAPAVAISKTVHYAPTPVVTGYTSTVIKPDLGHLATPPHLVSKTPVIAPARSVQTIVPKVTHVQPEVSVQKVRYT